MDNLASATTPRKEHDRATSPMNARHLCSHDPLEKLLLTITRGSPLRMVLIAMGVYGVFMVGAGAVISLAYANSGHQFMGIFDLRELPVALFVYLIAAPTIWAFYVWQPEAILQVLRDLQRAGVISQGQVRNQFDDFVHNTVSVRFARSRNTMISVVITLSGIIVGVVAVLDPDGLLYLGIFDLPYWWSLNRAYFWAIWVPLFFVNFYMLIWIAIRHFLVTGTLRELFRLFEVTPLPFHPDKCNGLGSVGRYGIRSVMLVVLLGFWLTLSATLPLAFREPANINAYSSLTLILYVLVIPASLVPLAWEAHLVMQEAKTEALGSLGAQMRGLLSGQTAEKSSEPVDAIGKLQKKREIVQQEYQTWPFQGPSLRRFSVAAIMPLLCAIAPAVIARF